MDKGFQKHLQELLRKSREMARQNEELAARSEDLMDQTEGLLEQFGKTKQNEKQNKRRKPGSTEAASAER